jgi:hypothetical protein
MIFTAVPPHLSLSEAFRLPYLQETLRRVGVPDLPAPLEGYGLPAQVAAAHGRCIQSQSQTHPPERERHLFPLRAEPLQVPLILAEDRARGLAAAELALEDAVSDLEEIGQELL